MTRRILSSLAISALALLAFADTASAQRFRPFTPAQDVCPDCAKTSTDVITLKSNETIKAQVVAENNAFYVVSRYGEVRVVPKGLIRSLDWANGSKPSGLLRQDQILLKSGHVVTGEIVEERDKPSYFKLQSQLNNQTFIVFKENIQAVYKGGVSYNFTM
ncbi:MAG: hypothetical protein AAGI01_13420 [Myxococcota bacterium]